MDSLKERCGIICDSNFYEIENVSIIDQEFVCDPIKFYEILMKICKGNIQAIVHTHNEECEPSYKDISSMKIWDVVWIILSKKCIRGVIYLNGRIFEINIHSFLSQELYNSIMKLLH